MVVSYRIRQSFSKTDAWLLRTSSLSAVFTLPANSAGMLVHEGDWFFPLSGMTCPLAEHTELFCENLE